MSDLPFQYTQYNDQIIPLLSTGQDVDKQTAIDILRRRDHELENYLADLPSGGTSGAGIIAQLNARSGTSKTVGDDFDVDVEWDLSGEGLFTAGTYYGISGYVTYVLDEGEDGLAAVSGGLYLPSMTPIDQFQPRIDFTTTIAEGSQTIRVPVTGGWFEEGDQTVQLWWFCDHGTARRQLGKFLIWAGTPDTPIYTRPLGGGG